MSGIAGIYCLDGRLVDRQGLQKMVDSLAHRGPDGAEIWSEGSIGFAHCILWTTPESLIEKLPLVRNGLIITADARIDNRDELKLVLNLPDRPLEKISDSEFILAAYEKWGEDCPKYLLGDFAFAIWNKHEQKLFCARDHFGVKPFYYYQSINSFIFASEIKALFSLPETPRRLNEVRIADFLALMMEDKMITTYQDILRLPPAHTLSITPTNAQLKLYWSLDRYRELRLNSDEEYAASFREIFTEAVRCRLRSAFPVGSHLSGGLDSSAVTCMARYLLRQQGNIPLHTFSSVFDEVPDCDERPYINAVLAQGDLSPHYVHADQSGPLSDLDQIWQYEDEAFTGPSHFLVWGVNQAAQKAGVRVVLGGFDGDSTVSHGVLRLTELAHQGQWRTFCEEVQSFANHFGCTPQLLIGNHAIPQLVKLAKQARWISLAIAIHQLHQHFRISRKRLLVNYGLKPVLLEPIRGILHRFRKRSPLKPSLDSLVHPNFAQRVRLEQRISTMDAFSLHPPQTVKEHHWYTLTAGTYSFILEQNDRYAAACSLEVRHPFMDKRLIEFCLALPSEQKLRHGWSRFIMRQALENLLPEAVQWRGGKANLTPNFLHGLLKLNRQLLDDVVFNQLECVEAYIDRNVFAAAYKRLTSGGRTDDADLMTVWRVVILALWFKHSQVKPEVY